MTGRYHERVRVALVHDWVTGMRGGERVLDALARALPEADLYTLFYQPGSTTAAIDALKIRASPLNRLPGVRRHYRKLLPLYPWAARHLEIEGYDLVLSISHAVAKNIRTEQGVPHLCYCLTPMRYVWDQVDAYLGHGLRRLLAAPLIAGLRRHDLAHNGPDEVDRFVAISSAVADRIQRTYGRRASIIHPPVDCDRIRPNGQEPEDFYLLVGGFVPYKREQVAIEAFRNRGDRLVVVGDGPTRRQLESSAPENVEFTGRIADAALASLFQRCRALIHPQDEDFGIAAVEAQAAGRPVIAFQGGGALDTVKPLFIAHEDGRLEWRNETHPTGIHFTRQDSQTLGIALDAFSVHAERFLSGPIREQAERFDRQRFVDAISREITELTEGSAPAG